MQHTSVGSTAPPEDAAPWAPGRAVCVAVGFLAGVGATGIAAGLGQVGTLLDVDLPVVDLSPLILLAPVVVIPYLAGAILGGWSGVAAVTAGAVAGPIGAIFALDSSCESSMFAAIGLVAIAFFALVIAALAAFAGDRIGGSERLKGNRVRRVSVLIAVGCLGVCGWIFAVPTLGACP
jgi:hypothetical protein